MLIAYDLVISRFTHSDQAKYNIFSNWIMWFTGKVYPPLSYVRRPDELVERGYSALCNGQAYLLQTLAEGIGIRTRAVGLYGHVVMEAWYANDWHLFDPDLEVVPLLKNQRILSLDELARSPELIRKYYADSVDERYIQTIVDIISSRENNSFVLYGTVEKHLNHRFEEIANKMKWIIPIILLIIGFIGLLRKGREV